MQFHKVVILSMSLVLGSFAQAQTPAQPAPLGLWERFCLNNKIGDACGRAIDSLTDKMAVASTDELMALQGRIDRVSELGCKLHNKSSCEQKEQAQEAAQEADEIQAQAVRAEADEG